MKKTFVIQHDYRDVSTRGIEQTVLADIKKQGIRQSDLEVLDIYYKPETREIYYAGRNKKTGKAVGRDTALHV